MCRISRYPERTDSDLRYDVGRFSGSQPQMGRAVIHYMIQLANEFIHFGEPLVQRGAAGRMPYIIFATAQQPSSH